MSVAFVFPGQGSQYSGMLRDLACQFPAMQETLAEANGIFKSAASARGKRRLCDFIYPPPTSTPDGKARHEQYRDSETRHHRGPVRVFIHMHVTCCSDHFIGWFDPWRGGLSEGAVPGLRV